MRSHVNNATWHAKSYMFHSLFPVFYMTGNAHLLIIYIIYVSCSQSFWGKRSISPQIYYVPKILENIMKVSNFKLKIKKKYKNFSCFIIILTYEIAVECEIKVSKYLFSIFILILLQTHDKYSLVSFRSLALLSVSDNSKWNCITQIGTWTHDLLTEITLGLRS